MKKTIKIILSLWLILLSLTSSVYAVDSGMERLDNFIFSTSADKTKLKIVIKNETCFSDYNYGLNYAVPRAKYDNEPFMGVDIKSSVIQFYRNPIEGLKSGILFLDVFYDFNGDGKWTQEEYVTSLSKYYAPSEMIQYEYTLSQEAVKYYDTNSYQADLAAIKAYMFKMCTYSGVGQWAGYDCGKGAGTLQVYSANKYNKMGSMVNLGGTHSGFQIDGETYEAQGYVDENAPQGVISNHGGTELPGSVSYNKKLAALEKEVYRLKALGL